MIRAVSEKGARGSLKEGNEGAREIFWLCVRLLLKLGEGEAQKIACEAEI